MYLSFIDLESVDFESAEVTDGSVHLIWSQKMALTRPLHSKCMPYVFEMYEVHRRGC